MRVIYCTRREFRSARMILLGISTPSSTKCSDRFLPKLSPAIYPDIKANRKMRQLPHMDAPEFLKTGEINWSDSTREIYALVRALAPPYPGAYTYLNARRITILRASPLANAPRYVGRIPGRVVGRSRQSGHVDVLTGDGVLRIHEVMAGDSVARPASAFIASTRQTLGLRTADLLARIELLESRLNSLDTTGRNSGS